MKRAEFIVLTHAPILTADERDTTTVYCIILYLFEYVVEESSNNLKTQKIKNVWRSELMS